MLEFNEIHSPFPRFRLGDEGLGTGEQPSHFDLGESCIQSGLLQPFQKGAILANVEVGFQWRPQFLRATVYKGMHLYPKIEYSGRVDLRCRIGAPPLTFGTARGSNFPEGTVRERKICSERSPSWPWRMRKRKTRLRESDADRNH